MLREFQLKIRDKNNPFSYDELKQILFLVQVNLNLQYGSAISYDQHLIEVQRSRFFPEALVKKLETGKHIFLLVLDGDRIVAFGDLDRDEEFPEIKSIFVDVRYRNRRIGRGILQKLELLASELNLQKVFVLTLIEMLSFYTSNHFKIESTQIIELSGAEFSFVLLKKEIPIVRKNRRFLLK